MRLKRSTATVVGAAVVGVLAMPAKPASAAGDYTVTSGGATTAVTATNAGYLFFEDTYLGPFGDPSNPRITCTSLDSPGTVNPGEHGFTGGPPVTDAAVELMPAPGDLSGCTTPTVGPIVSTLSGTWQLGLTDRSATGGTAYLSGVSVHFYFTAGGAFCQFDVEGTLRGTYDHTTGDLALDPGYEGLVISDVGQTNSLCESFFPVFDDDPAVFGGTINLSPAPVIS